MADCLCADGIHDTVGNDSKGNDHASLRISAEISLYKNGFNFKNWMADADEKLYAVKHK